MTNLSEEPLPADFWAFVLLADWKVLMEEDRSTIWFTRMLPAAGQHVLNASQLDWVCHLLDRWKHEAGRRALWIWPNSGMLGAPE